MSDGPSKDAFSLREILGETLASLRADWRAHVGWNVIWIGLALVSCCGITMLLAVAGFAIYREGSETARSESPIAVVVAVYVLLIPLSLALYALHQSVTMTLVRARSRGAPMILRVAIARGFARTPALTAHLLLRMIVEGVPILIAYFVAFGIVWGVMGVSDLPLGGRGPGVGAVLGVTYVLVMVVAFGARGFLGLGFPCVVDGVGPYAALGQSVRLLAGRRWQFIRKRLAVLATWFLSYAVCVGPFFAVTLLNREHPNPALGLVTMPMLLGFYVVMLFLLVFDAALEATFHARVTRPIDAAALAATFE